MKKNKNKRKTFSIQNKFSNFKCDFCGKIRICLVGANNYSPLRDIKLFGV